MMKSSITLLAASSLRPVPTSTFSAPSFGHYSSNATPSSHPVVAVAGVAFEEECPKEGAEDVDVGTSRSDDAASKVINDFIIEKEAWVESAETSS